MKTAMILLLSGCASLKMPETLSVPDDPPCPYPFGAVLFESSLRAPYRDAITWWQEQVNIPLFLDRPHETPLGMHVPTIFVDTAPQDLASTPDVIADTRAVLQSNGCVTSALITVYKPGIPAIRHALAHELGHVLLGSVYHNETAWSLMHATIDTDFEGIGELLPEELANIRARYSE